MKKISTKLILLFSLFAILISCSEEEIATEVDLITFEGNSANRSFGVIIDGETTRTIKIFSSKATSADRVVNISVDTDLTTVDPAAYAVSSSATILAGERSTEFTVTIQDINIGSGKQLVLNLSSPSGSISGKPLVFDVTQLCTDNEVILNLGFDSWAEEVAWQLYNDDTNTLVEQADYNTYDDLDESTFSKTFCLADGNYTFIIYDGYGDGGNVYSLTQNGVTIISGGPAYGAGEQQSFTLGN
jgi:hypothetical protein